MTPRRRQRLVLVSLMLCAVGASVAFALNAFRSNLMLFHAPSDVAAGAVEPGRPFRIGGMVVEGSVERAGEDLAVRFALSDTAETVPVSFEGILPDLFAEGQGIVATGRLGPDGTFVADEVLAKHDENYMPPEVADALAKVGRMPGTSATFAPAATVVDP